MNRRDAREGVTFPAAGADSRALQAQSTVAADAVESRVPGSLRSPYLTLISRLVLGFIFLLSGLTKLGIPNTFAVSIQSYEMPLPAALVQLMAVALPPIELAIGLLLLAGLWTRISAIIAGALMLVFIVAMIQAMFRGLSPDCGCFAGAGSNPRS